MIAARFDKILEEEKDGKGKAEADSVNEEPAVPRANGLAKANGGSAGGGTKRKPATSPSAEEDARLAARLQAEWNSMGRPSRSGTTKRRPVIPRRKRKVKTGSDNSDDEQEKKRKRKINKNNPFHASFPVQNLRRARLTPSSGSHAPFGSSLRAPRGDAGMSGSSNLGPMAANAR